MRHKYSAELEVLSYDRGYYPTGFVALRLTYSDAHNKVYSEKQISLEELQTEPIFDLVFEDLKLSLKEEVKKQYKKQS